MCLKANISQRSQFWPQNTLFFIPNVMTVLCGDGKFKSKLCKLQKINKNSSPFQKRLRSLKVKEKKIIIKNGFLSTFLSFWLHFCVKSTDLTGFWLFVTLTLRLQRTRKCVQKRLKCRYVLESPYVPKDSNLT